MTRQQQAKIESLKKELAVLKVERDNYKTSFQYTNSSRQAERVTFMQIVTNLRVVNANFRDENKGLNDRDDTVTAQVKDLIAGLKEAERKTHSASEKAWQEVQDMMKEREAKIADQEKTIKELEDWKEVFSQCKTGTDRAMMENARELVALRKEIPDLKNEAVESKAQQLVDQKTIEDLKQRLKEALGEEVADKAEKGPTDSPIESDQSEGLS